ncbi:hypothetical protein Pfo_024184 [Paulownia fortunei]|nr:hypothetical protein Pfo_024184 [Paulownia fortunei]
MYTERTIMMTDWADLPEELLSLILSNLFAKDRHTFSLVCKSWNSAAKVSPFRHSPCLMLYERSNCMWKIFQYNSFFCMDFPELNQAEIRCSKYGWMLMSREDCSMFFFDPFNNEMIELPKSDFQYTTICFFHPPTSPDCFIIGISSKMCPLNVIIGLLKHGGDEWKTCTYHSKTEFLLSICTPILHRGLLYCLDVEGNVATFDISNNGSPVSWFVNSKCLHPPRLRKKNRRHFLIKLREEEVLLAVLVAHDERKVNVFRLLEPDMKWEMVEHLGDKVLYVSHTASFAATASSENMANKIYFPKIHGDNGVFYCLSTQKYHSFKGDYSSSKSYGFKDLEFATWITPTPTPEFPRDLTWCTKNGY